MTTVVIVLAAGAAWIAVAWWVARGTVPLSPADPDCDCGEPEPPAILYATFDDPDPIVPTGPCVRCGVPAECGSEAATAIGGKVVAGVICVACSGLCWTDPAAFWAGFGLPGEE